MTMDIVSFDPFRSMGIPGATYLKPENIFSDKELIQTADWVIFPQYWQVNFLAYGWKKNIFPNLPTYHLGHDKVEMTRALQAVAPDHVPYTLIKANSSEAREQVLDEFSFPFIAKEIKNSMGQGVYLITSVGELDKYLKQNDVLYIQEYLPIDRDLRVVYVGNRVVSAYWRIGQDSFKNNVAQGGRIDFAEVPRDIIDLVENTAQALGINHAGFDVAIDGNQLYFFEFNVMFGNQALLQANVPLAKYIHDYLVEESKPEPPKPLLPFDRVS